MRTAAGGSGHGSGGDGVCAPAQRVRQPIPEVDVGDDTLGAAAEEPVCPQRGLDIGERADLDHAGYATASPSRAAARLDLPARHDHRERDRHDHASDGEPEQDRAHVERLEQPAEREHRDRA